jgi:phospholipase/carboxylesterase
VHMQVAFELSNVAGPHRGATVYQAGAPLADAQAAFVMAHGRGSSAADILSLGHALDLPGLVYLAPEAASGAWYPQRFTAQLEDNEPWLSSALSVVNGVLSHLATGGIPLARTYLLGFSQGACLMLEYAARNPGGYGGLIGLSGALIGPDAKRPLPEGGSASLAAVPVFLGCSDVDPHIPLSRVEAAASWFIDAGAVVTTRIYPHMGHTVNLDEVRFIQELAGRPEIRE